MSKHYKKLFLLLIPLSVGFCLALSLGSAEELSEFCQHCQNKAMVKREIDAYVEAHPHANLMPLSWRCVVDFFREPCEFCRLRQNKALVKEAILAFDKDPNDRTLPENFDPNYVQYGPDHPSRQQPYPHSSGRYIDDAFVHEPVTFENIIAEGDMVSVRLTYSKPYDHTRLFYYRELATYRISRGKIVEGWVASIWWIPDSWYLRN